MRRSTCTLLLDPATGQPVPAVGQSATGKPRHHGSSIAGHNTRAQRALRSLLCYVLLLPIALLITGCGGGGYPGAGLTGASASTNTIDAGQSIPESVTEGGNLPVTWTLSGTTCGSACGSISSTSGTSITYTAPSPVTTPFVVTLTASIAGTSNTRTVTVNVNPAPAIVGTPPVGNVGSPYTFTFTTPGGTSPKTLKLLSGTLPAGLTFNAATGVVSGTPTAMGTSSFVLQLVDSSDVPYTVTATEQITIAGPLNGSGGAGSLVVSGAPPAGTVGMAYSTTLQATGGTSPYTWAITSGALPAGLTLNAATGVISGTPTAAGTSTFTAGATDSAGNTASSMFSIVVSASKPAIGSGMLPTGTVGSPYTGTIPVTGGTGPYQCTVTSGTLPAGLTLGANCTVTGTPTAPGTTTVTVGVTDSNNPPGTGSGTVTITVNAKPVSLTTGTLPNGTVGVPYSSTVGVTGGTAPYTCALAGGNLPTGLTLNTNCSVTGTPTTAGTSSIMVKATDSANPSATTTGTVGITIAPTAALVVGNPPAATTGAPYTGTIPVTGGTGPYQCTVTSGTLPAGLTLGANCAITGTPTTPGTTTVTVGTTDSGNPPDTGSGTVTITVNPPPASLTLGTPPAATVGTPYTGTIPVSGGTSPYSCTITAGTLPAGLTFGANCTVTGTPTTAGSSTVTVSTTDAGNPAKTGSGMVVVTVNPTAGSLTLGTPPAGTVGTPYTGTIPVTGGTSPYSCTITAGTLPTGLSLGANCAITGTPTTAGATTVTVASTDSTSPAKTGSGTVTITINPATNTLALGTPPAATVGTPYTGTIPVSGGTAPYSCTVTAGTLPAGLTLGANCTLIGTPTTAGVTTITVASTDSSSPTKTGTGTVTVTVNPAPTTTLTVGTPPAATVGTPYTGTIPVSGGTGPYQCTVTAGTLPAGLTLGANCAVTGTPTTPGTTTVTVGTTDSGNPTGTGSGTVTITVNPAPTSLTLGTPPAATVGTPYTGTIPVGGGNAPYNCTVTAGTLPTGLTLGANCGITGTPTVAGSSTVTVAATDSSNPVVTGSGSVVVTVNPVAGSLTLGTPPAATVGTPYTGTIPVTGGTAPYNCTVPTGTLPAGLTLGANCALAGTPTTAGASTVTVVATDSGNPTTTGSSMVTITVNPAPGSLTLGTPPAATVGTPYTGTIPVSGGTAPYNCTVTVGTLPAGLTLGANCTVTGTPTTPGTTTVTVGATDSGSPTGTGSGTVTITVNPSAVTLAMGPLPNGTVGTPYTGTVSVSGGTSPYTCTQAGGVLPAGLALNGNCSVTGTPTVAGTTTVSVTVTDSGTPNQTTTGNETITISPAALALSAGTLPSGTVGTPYTGTVGVGGGTAPYTCTQAGGTLPAGLTLNANCTVTGTPTVAGTTTVSVTATDSGNPAQTTTGNETITINPAALALGTGTLPNGTVGTPYTASIGVSGGTTPYTCAQTGGTLPAGLTLNANCSVSGTPTVAGTTTVMVRATDSGNPTQTTTANEPITINPAALMISTAPLPNGTVGTPYTANIGVSGGTAPYTCAEAGGTLPAGLTLNANCSVTGTPTVAGTTTVMVRVTDSGNPAQTYSASEPITINPAPALTIGSPAAGTVGTPYTGTIPVSGGTAPYTCAQAGGTLPAGLTFNSNCTVTGTPTAAGSSIISVTATDSSSPATTTTSNVTVAVNPAPVTLTVGNPPAATVSTPYTGTIPVAGGTAPYTCTLAGGTLPTGLTFNTNCTLTGTPTTAGTTTLQVTATDSATPTHTVTGPAVVTVQPLPALTFTGSLPNGVVGQAYSQTLQATGGVGPYTYAVTAGMPPAGLTLSSGGVLSGTPTAPGASSFTVTATDSEGTPMTAALPLVLLITYPTTPNDTLLQGPYAFLFQGYDDVVLGVLAYQTATAGSITANGAGLITAGEQDSNGQGSLPAGTTVDTRNLLGTYTIGTDNRGFLTLTSFNTDGTVNLTHTYAIALKAPVAPSTTSARGSFIEFDDANVVGTRGNGTLLAQSPTAITAGLNGSYAFGLQGDTPCLPTCTIGIVAGPVASVGQFNAANFLVTGGSVDANIGAVKYSNEALTGSYTIADTNGRVQLVLQAANLPAGVFPTDYVAYVVDGSNLLIVSTDKHSAYILQAGTGALQTQSTFSNASLTGPFVGYENSPVNPGLLGVTLQQVLNYQTATIIQATGNGAGGCTTNTVSSSGATGIINSLGGLITDVQLASTLLGNYQTTGGSNCTVGANGRGEFDYPTPSSVLSILVDPLGLGAIPPAPRIVYLTSPGTGYFLETSYAGLGKIEAQSGTPYTNASLIGTFVYASSPASSLATINSNGIFTADGQGNDVSLVDRNIGVGNINVLSLAVAVNGTYGISDSTAGRFSLSTGETVYEIAPGRFVLLEPVINTAPYIALLY